MERLRRLSVFVMLLSLLAVLVSACATTTTTGSTGGNGPLVQIIPDPTNSATSLFCGGSSCSLDNTYVQVNFTHGFTFPFFGTTYSSVWINTNGGVTFGAGDSRAAPAATSIPEPGIAILLGGHESRRTRHFHFV